MENKPVKRRGGGFCLFCLFCFLLPVCFHPLTFCVPSTPGKLLLTRSPVIPMLPEERDIPQGSSCPSAQQQVAQQQVVQLNTASSLTRCPLPYGDTPSPGFPPASTHFPAPLLTCSLCTQPASQSRCFPELDPQVPASSWASALRRLTGTAHLTFP